MVRTWKTIEDAGTDLVDLDFVRLVSRADINKIASSNFKDRVIDLAQGEVHIYLANDDCVKRMSNEEVYSYKNNEWIKNFIDAGNSKLMKRIIPETEWKPRYLNNTLSLLGNLFLLKHTMKSKPGKVKVFLYEGHQEDNNLPTFRGTLINSKKGKKAFVSIMPRKATGMASSVISIDNYFIHARQELEKLNPTEVSNIDETISLYIENIRKFSDELDEFKKADRSKFGGQLNDLSQPYRRPDEYVEKIYTLQDIITQTFSEVHS